MSVVVKGMPMPESCYDCPFCYDQQECSATVSGAIELINFTAKDDAFADFIRARHPRCPLEEER